MSHSRAVLASPELDPQTPYCAAQILRRLAWTIVVGAVAVLPAASALAQNQGVEEFVVTGTYIRRQSQFDSPSPLVMLSADDLAATGAEGRGLLALADAFDRNMERLNTQLYGPLDYAVIAWKP